VQVEADPRRSALPNHFRKAAILLGDERGNQRPAGPTAAQTNSLQVADVVARQWQACLTAGNYDEGQKLPAGAGGRAGDCAEAIGACPTLQALAFRVLVQKNEAI